MRIISWITSLFSTDAKVRHLQNGVAHLVIDYHVATAKIRKAKAKFENVRAYHVSDFQSKKKATMDRTRSAVASMSVDLAEEGQDLDKEYAEAKAKHAIKETSVSALYQTVDQIGGTEFPLE